MLPSIYQSAPLMYRCLECSFMWLFSCSLDFCSLPGSLLEAPIIMHYALYRKLLLSVWEDTSESWVAPGSFSYAALMARPC